MPPKELKSGWNPAEKSWGSNSTRRNASHCWPHSIKGLVNGLNPIDLAWDQLPNQLRGLEACWTTDVTDSATLRIGFTVPFRARQQRTQALIADTSVATDVRLQAMKNLAELAGDSAIDSLLPILEDSASTEQLRLTAIDGLQRFRDDRIRITFLDLYSGTASLSPHTLPAPF
ncbi:MAG: hypothetical protein U0872_06320 [Planctomycetaceae bacterium]